MRTVAADAPAHSLSQPFAQLPLFPPHVHQKKPIEEEQTRPAAPHQGAGADPLPTNPVAAAPHQPASANPRRDVVAVMTQRVLSMALEELRSEETRKYVNDNLVLPLLRAVFTELMPYAIVFVTVIAAILLMSALTLTLSTMFYFRTK